MLRIPHARGLHAAALWVFIRFFHQEHTEPTEPTEPARPTEPTEPTEPTSGLGGRGGGAGNGQAAQTRPTPRAGSFLSTFGTPLTLIFKGLRPPAADPQQNEGMMLRGYENHEAIALVTCAS